jgi:hypothetical protein
MQQSQGGVPIAIEEGIGHTARQLEVLLRHVAPSFRPTAGQGFEPRFSGPEPDVLPLDDPAIDGKA